MTPFQFLFHQFLNVSLTKVKLIRPQQPVLLFKNKTTLSVGLIHHLVFCLYFTNLKSRREAETSADL